MAPSDDYLASGNSGQRLVERRITSVTISEQVGLFPGKLGFTLQSQHTNAK
jgi:hypothetical protein